MINLPAKKLREGMITSQSVYNAKGVSYLSKGTRLNQPYIRRLKKLGITRLSVTSLNPSLHLLPPEDIVQEKTRITAIHKVCEAFAQLEVSNTLNLESLENIAESIVFDLISKQSNLAQITDIRLHDTYTFAHSVNVAVLSSMLGSLCHYSKKNLLDLTLGGLLHDVGKLVIPSSILNKSGSLNEEEFSIIRQHPEAGCQKLRKTKTASALMLAITAQHHERIDGTGYPKQLAGNSIHRFSRIVSIADVYDALTSARPYKKAYKPYVAYKIMTKCSEGQFDLDLLSLFFDSIALYPIGTILKTDLGYGIVKKVEFGHTQTPIICVFADEKYNTYSSPTIVNLKNCPPNTINYVLEDNDLFTFIKHVGIDPAAYLTTNKQPTTLPAVPSL